MSTPKPRSLADMPEIAFADQTTTVINTGSWKSQEPRFEDKLPPCSQACPCGNDISKMVALLAAGDAMAAARLLRTGNPLPSTLGRVCPHFCEAPCNRQDCGDRVSVHTLERFLGDWSLDADLGIEPAPSTSRKAAIIGSGPAGIAAAYALALNGHEVEVFDDKPQPGGYLRTGIPDYRLPKSILDREIARVQHLGVTFTQNTRIGLNAETLFRRFDAVIVAVGLHKSRNLNLAGAEHHDVHNGVELLEQILQGRAPKLPKRVAVIGGGNTAMDVARSVLRLGVKPVVVYRRSEAEMPAIASEVQEAKREGVEFLLLATPKPVVTNGEAIVALECLRTRLGEPDASGRRTPVASSGTEFRLPVAGIINATGESVDLDFIPQEVRKSDWFFLAGDASTSDGTVTAAMGDGRRIADLVDGYLRTGIREREKPALQALWQRTVNLEQVAGPELLNSAYFISQPQKAIHSKPPTFLPTTFDEIVPAIDLDTAIAEARRCLSCGTCNTCLNCYYWCPDIAIHKDPDHGGLQIDPIHCKGCGICVEECPRGALSLGEVSQ